MKGRVFYITLGFCAALFWGYSFVWVKQALKVYQPLTILLGRHLVATIVLFILVRLFAKKKFEIKKSDYKLFGLMTLFEPLLYFIGETYGIRYMSAGLAAIIIATIPLFSPIAAFFLAGEDVKGYQIVGIICSFIGIFIIALNNSFELYNPLGLFLMSIAVVAALGYSICCHKLLFRYSPVQIVLVQNTFGIVYFLPLFLIFEFGTLNSFVFDTTAFFAIFFLGIFPGVVAFLAYNTILRHLGLVRTIIFINIIPVMTIAIAYFVLDEQIGLRKVFGTAFVLFGLFLSQRVKKGITNSR